MFKHCGHLPQTVSNEQGTQAESPHLSLPLPFFEEGTVDLLPLFIVCFNILDSTDDSKDLEKDGVVFDVAILFGRSILSVVGTGRRPCSGQLSGEGILSIWVTIPVGVTFFGWVTSDGVTISAWVIRFGGARRSLVGD